MAGWASMKNQQVQNLKGFDETHDLIMGHIIQSQKPGNDLIQNCDLPPPVKVFSKSDSRNVISNMSRKKHISNSRLTADQDEESEDGDGKLGVLKALRLSQTRAREAEAKYAVIAKERDSLAFAFLADSVQLSAYRQLLRLLDFQVSQLQKERMMARRVCCDCQKSATDEGDDDHASGSDCVSWVMTVAFCLGIAGIGVAIGYRYWF